MSGQREWRMKLVDKAAVGMLFEIPGTGKAIAVKDDASMPEFELDREYVFAVRAAEEE